MTGGNHFGDVALAPYHDLDSKVPADVKTKIDKIVADVTAGTLKTGYTPSADAEAGHTGGGRCGSFRPTFAPSASSEDGMRSPRVQAAIIPVAGRGVRARDRRGAGAACRAATP